MCTFNLTLQRVSLCLAQSLTHCTLSVCLLSDACHEHRTPHYRGERVGTFTTELNVQFQY